MPWPPPRHQWPLLVQTWPTRIPEFRSYVFAHKFAQVPIEQHDARPVRDLLLQGRAPGVLMIEWDIALDGDHLRELVCRADAQPEEGFVAPYKLWPGPNWGHRIWNPDGEPTCPEGNIRWVGEDDKACNLPCFGCIYIPRAVLEAWRPVPHDPRLTDSNFAWWAKDQGLWWPILWDVRPVHLHY